MGWGGGVGRQTPTRHVQPYTFCIISKPSLKKNNKPYLECCEKDFYRNTQFSQNSINTKNNPKNRSFVFKMTEKQVICYQTDVFTGVIDCILYSVKEFQIFRL